MKTLNVKWTGFRPLIMSNPQTVQLSNPFAVEGRRIQAQLKAARKKQDEDKLMELEQEQARNDWEASAYYDTETNRFFIPDTVILASIRSGATAMKKGKDVDRAMIVNEPEVPVEGVPVHRSLTEYWKDEKFRLECPAKVPPKTGALIWKVRAMMPTGWTLTFSVDYEESLIAQKTVVDAMETSGRLSGLGGWRPKFGRFSVEIG